MKYKSIIATRRGPPEILRIIENDLGTPKTGKVRVKILASSVSLPDVQARYGHTPFAPKIPFVPGYAIIGVVDAIGEDVTSVIVGDRVGALTIIGGSSSSTSLITSSRTNVAYSSTDPNSIS